jgi:hypothetical protein
MQVTVDQLPVRNRHHLPSRLSWSREAMPERHASAASKLSLRAKARHSLPRSDFVGLGCRRILCHLTDRALIALGASRYVIGHECAATTHRAWLA